MEKNVGYLEISVGPMCSGKTTYLFDKLNNFTVFGYRCIYINHAIDTRSSEAFSTHNKLLKVEKDIEMVKVNALVPLLETLSDYEFIGIDEAQFFDDLVPAVKSLIYQKKKVFVGGLMGDFLMNKFGPVLDLIPMCDHFRKLDAFCSVCMRDHVYKPASFSKRIVPTTDQIAVGDTTMYIPVCRKCYLL
jgi:thymidine kinase